MNLTDKFFKEMEDLFLESDKSSFYELREDLMEHIDIQLSEGKNEQEVIHSLGTPKEIVDDFYEDQRLHTALTAEKDVVPIEKVKKAYKDEKKGKRKTFFARIKQLIGSISLLFLFIIIILFSIAFIHEALIEHYFALPPLTLAIFFSAIFLLILRIIKKLKHKKMLYLIGTTLILSISSIAYLSITNSWFHNGTFYRNELTIDANQILNLTINTDYHADVMTVPIANDDQARIEIQGYMHSSVIKKITNLKPNSKNINVNLGQRTFFNFFSCPKKNEVILYVPQNEQLDKLELNLKDANLQLTNLTAKTINLNIDQGDIQISNLQATDMDIKSISTDIFMSNYATTLTIDNYSGKSILKNGQGIAKLQTESGLINIQNTSSTDFSIANISGKSVLNDTLLQKLNITNQDGTVVLENQSGNSTLKNESGKLILNNNSGFVEINNDSGALIISQDKNISGTINSHDGIVKWVQLDTVPLDFQLKSTSGRVINEFDRPIDPSTEKVSITTDSGEIRIIQKNNEDGIKDPEASKF